MPLACSLLGLTACAAPSEDSLPPIERGDIHFVAPLTEPSHATGSLIGWNIGRGTLYGVADDPLHPEWRTPERTAAFELMRKIRPLDGPTPRVRFSGLQIDGALGNDGYHFWSYADPEHVVADDDNMAPFQYMAIVDELDAEPLVTLNFGSGTASEAAEYVTHVVGTDASDPLVAARAHWGRTEPWRPPAYEIGNEIYGFWNTGFTASGDFSYANPEAEHGGDAEWHGRPASNAADYAARALTYVERVLAVDPAARFWVPLSQASMDGWGGLDSALAGLAPLLSHPTVQAVVVHHYQVDDAAAKGLFDRAAPELSIAGSELFRADYARLLEMLAELDRSEPLQLVVTEYHVGGAFTLGDFEPVADTHRVGLGVADIMIMYAQLGVHEANQHMAVAFGAMAEEELLFESWYNPIAEVDGQMIPRSSYVATKLIADHLLPQTVVLEPDVALTNRYAEGGSAGFDYPVAHGVGFWDGEDRATLVVLSRDLEQTHSVSFDLPPGDGWRADANQVYAPADLTTSIGGTRTMTTKTEVTEGLDRIRFELPPHALVAVSLTRR